MIIKKANTDRVRAHPRNWGKVGQCLLIPTLPSLLMKVDFQLVISLAARTGKA